jgi:hypothetical protein
VGGAVGAAKATVKRRMGGLALWSCGGGVEVSGRGEERMDRDSWGSQVVRNRRLGSPTRGRGGGAAACGACLHLTPPG